MKDELSYSERMERYQQLHKFINELEIKYPFLHESNRLQKWNELLDHYFFNKDYEIKSAFLRQYEGAIKNFSDFCLYSKPISISTVMNCNVFVTSKQEYGIFKGWVYTVQESNTDYVIVKFNNASRLIHKNNIFEIKFK